MKICSFYTISSVLVFLIIFLNIVSGQIAADGRYKSRYVGGLKGGKNVYADKYKSKKPRFVVTSSHGLLDALRQSKSGDLIYIPGETEINLTGLKEIQVPGGVIIKGDRGLSNSKGALLYTTDSGVQPLFEVVGNDVVFFGLRIRGDDGDVLRGPDAFENRDVKENDPMYLELYHRNMYATPVSSGIATFANNLTVENCEIYQWTNNGIYFKKGARGGKVFHSYIHHNQRFGLGYGVTTNQAEILVEANLFDYNKHSIASTGRVGSIYVVRGNIFKENGNWSWSVDMHGGKDKGEGNNIAGTKLLVYDNIFYLKGKGKAVVVRGRPVEPSHIYNNKIIYVDDRKLYGKNPFSQYNAKGNFNFFDNEIVEN